MGKSALAGLMLVLLGNIAQASPAQCLEDWGQENTSILIAKEVKFGISNTPPINGFWFDDSGWEAFYDTKINDLTDLGKIVTNAAKACGCLPTYVNSRHIEGICGTLLTAESTHPTSKLAIP